MELINLATQLDEATLNKIGALVHEEYTSDEQSRAEWLDMHAEWMELYYQTHTSINPAWLGSSQESIPVLTEACNQFQARAYKAFFPNRDFIQAIPMSEESLEEEEIAERIGKHMSYQLSVKDRRYKPDKNAMFLAAALHGCDFSKTFYDPVRRKNVVERVRAVDLVLPYGYGPARLEDIERKTHVIYMSVNKAKRLYQKEFFIAMPRENDVDEKSRIQQVEDEAQGLEDTLKTGRKPVCILEQHRLLDLDEDGIAEPYIVWVDKNTRQTLRIQIRYNVDQMGNATDNKEPVEYFTKFGFLTNPDGIYDLGMGHLLGKLNVAVNKILRQSIDAGTLANVGNMSGFISEHLGAKGDEVELTIGKFIKIPKTVDDIRKAVFQFTFPGPNAAFMETMQFLEQVAQRVGATTDAVTGDVDKVIQPLTIMTMLESSLQLPTSIMEQMALSFEDEFDKLYKLNQKYMTQPDYYVDGKEAVMVKPEDYSMELRIIPILDPRNITRQQKVAKNQELFQFAMANPVLMQNGQAMEEITRRVLRAMEIEDIDSVLPPPSVPENIPDQTLENMYFLLPQGSRPAFDVYPDQDHVDHIAKIDEFLDWLTSDDPIEGAPLRISQDIPVDMTIQRMSEDLKMKLTAELMEHRTKHLAYVYGQTQGVIDGQGNVRTMAQSAGNQTGAEEAIRQLLAGGGMENMPGGGGGALPGPITSLGLPAQPAEPGILGLSDLGLNPPQ